MASEKFDNIRNIIGNAAKSIMDTVESTNRSRTSEIADTLGTLNNVSRNSSKVNNKVNNNSTKMNSILADLDNTINQNVSKLQEYGIDANSPRFMQNHIAEKIQDKNSANSIASSTVTAVSADTESSEDIKTMISQKEKDETVVDANKPIKLLDRKKVKALEAKLQERVFGQNEVIEEVTDILKVAALGIKINKEKPAGCYLFTGPSGVGKTELAQSVADSLGVPLLIINMGEYGLEQDVTKLIGTSKGYVGYNEGGLLTNFVKENPACVILFDELEKGHSSIDKILLSVMDKGSCTDNKGNEVKFKETIIISTSNLGAEVEYIRDLTKEEKNHIRMQSIKGGLRPEIINRYDSIFHFNALSAEIYKLVTDKFLNKLNETMLEEHEFTLKFTPKLIDFIVEKSYDPAMGGRPARKFIEKVVIKPLSDYMLEDEFEEAAKTSAVITMDLNKDGNIYFKAKNKILGVLDNTAEIVGRIEEGKFTNKAPTQETLKHNVEKKPQEAVQVLPKKTKKM
jgi:ATP-dependent Clp protease ATP-binding subunit ClpA